MTLHERMMQLLLYIDPNLAITVANLCVMFEDMHALHRLFGGC
jgi:hypothetical protein